MRSFTRFGSGHRLTADYTRRYADRRRKLEEEFQQYAPLSAPDLQESKFPDDHREAIEKILSSCQTQQCSIVIITRPEAKPSEAPKEPTQVMTYTHAPDVDTADESLKSDPIVDIGEVVEPLVAFAVLWAVKVKSRQEIVNNAYAEFRDADLKPLYWLLDDPTVRRFKKIPGADCYLTHYLLHHYRLPSFNETLSLNDMLDRCDGKMHPFQDDQREERGGHNDMNYKLIALVVEHLWGNSFAHFMRETLFKPLKMDSTSIDAPGNKVDNASMLYSTGPIAAYSTARDLGIFYRSMMESFHGMDPYQGLDVTFIDLLITLQVGRPRANSTSNATIKLKDFELFTMLGQFTTLNFTDIGSMSRNRGRWPDDEKPRCATMPGSLGKRIEAYYMANTGTGSSCATAFLPSDKGNSFAVVVTANESGPADTSDYLLRWVLTEILAPRRGSQKFLDFRPKDVVVLAQREEGRR